jgi:hypothetical protein
MQPFVRVLATLLVVALVIGIGAAIYNVGVDVGMNAVVQAGAASGDPVAAPYAYGYGPYWHGPGFFGIFFWILGFFLIFALIRAAFGWGNGGPRGPGGWGGRRERLEEMHRELHRNDGPNGERAASS